MDLCQVLKALLLFPLFSVIELRAAIELLNAPELQEERAGGYELHTCAVKVILPKQEVLIEIIVCPWT